jgi:hypothetical protein
LFLPLEIDDHFFTLVSIQLELVDIRPPLDISNGVLDKGFAIPWNNYIIVDRHITHHLCIASDKTNYTADDTMQLYHEPVHNETKQLLCA